MFPLSGPLIVTKIKPKLLFLLVLAECRAQTDSVLQPEGEDVVAAEGETRTLGCLYNTSASNHYLYWYKQDGGSSPKFLLSRFKVGDGKTAAEKRFSSSLDPSVRSVPLTIQDLQLSDSAVYYCALQPTVTGNSTTLYKNMQYSPISTRGQHILDPEFKWRPSPG
uniref:T-cell receptor alpha/delta variable 27.0 n=1 Tax=Fundulus heteroclitus TaxID=8078 RepID=A0A3Q2Q829_FUNHE